jgi:hypothetical protein
MKSNEYGFHNRADLPFVLYIKGCIHFMALVKGNFVLYYEGLCGNGGKAPYILHLRTTLTRVIGCAP